MRPGTRTGTSISLLSGFGGRVPGDGMPMFHSLPKMTSVHPWAMALEAFLYTRSHLAFKNPAHLRVFHIEEETMEINGHDLMPSGRCPSSSGCL